MLNLNTTNKGWMVASALNWTRYENRVICLVDWGELALTDYRAASLNHTRVIGFYLAHIIRTQFDPNETVVAGHSLGAQIAGFCGSALNGALKTIYGLDPAGPSFTIPFIVDISQRLDPTDAQHVQCLHTDFILGTSLSCGISDYYSHLALRQPGCFTNVCNHDRATAIFESSMNPNYAFSAKECQNGRNAWLNRCNGESDRFGIHGKHLSGQFYFKTTNCYPYCLQCAV